MWGKPAEFRRLVQLRRAAKDALTDHPPLAKNIALDIQVSVGPVNARSTGDLDNFITGICDGLQAADPRCTLHPGWVDQQDISPAHPIAILDDCAVLSITARKIIGEPIGYTVVLDGDET